MQVKTFKWEFSRSMRREQLSFIMKKQENTLWSNSHRWKTQICLTPQKQTAIVGLNSKGSAQRFPILKGNVKNCLHVYGCIITRAWLQIQVTYLAPLALRDVIVIMLWGLLKRNILISWISIPIINLTINRSTTSMLSFMWQVITCWQ